MGLIEFDRVSKSYTPGEPVLKDITFEVEEGEFVVLLGASGCGKTTTLKIVNKLIPYTSGSVRFKGYDLSRWPKVKLRRSIGYVIQQVGLFPHMDINHNISFVRRIQGQGRQSNTARSQELLELVGLDASYLRRYPHALSGGERQRVGVARALAADPEVLLMDEPFGAVDEITRRHLQDEMLRIQEKLRKTVLFVTHDIEEAIRLADRIALFNDGRLEHFGTPESLVFNPASEYVRSFLGLKGFKASMDPVQLEKAYEAVLKGERRLKDVFRVS